MNDGTGRPPAVLGTHRGNAHPLYPPSLGAIPLDEGRCSFCVWAPNAERVELHLTAPEERTLVMHPAPRGYFHRIVEGVAAGARYLFRLDGDRARPDPASRSQPDGVHQPSEIVSPAFGWTDHTWPGLPLDKYITYELHVGTFTPGGTFDSAIERLDDLADLGVTAIELMPVAQFPGTRNWGYDGVYPSAAQNSYGGPDGLRRFVDACHGRGLAVVLDVVYNHLGPEGNYLSEFGHYFTQRHRTPWGAALNFDGPWSDEVRRYFIESALYWIRDCHIDALRLDAVHAIFDQSARPFLQELADAVRLQGEIVNRRTYTIAESNLNDPRMVSPKELGGHGIDAQWVDDLHHALHTALTGERTGYYEDFRGFSDLAESWREGFVFCGQYSRYRGRRHGVPARSLAARRFVIAAQNHDQVGNRMLGERLAALVSFEQLKVAAGVVLLSPYLPLLFMGEEYGEPAPFQFFTSHGDPGLVEAVRRGRKEEFATFRWEGEPPDPQDENTYHRCRLNWQLRHEGRHATLFRLHQTLIELRKSHPALALLSRDHMQTFVFEKPKILASHRWTVDRGVFVVFHLGESAAPLSAPLPAGRWEKIIDTADARWDGPGSSLPAELESSGEVPLTAAPHSFVLYSRAP
ncbi:MAG TPA: malto-oligosyltrehalose trehalohydrolase [Planctomycetaceae bacterium]|nr:malto-oligosyltrehalose trehalohydrolase [Planctomycetaceae bacterium]